MKFLIEIGGGRGDAIWYNEITVEANSIAQAICNIGDISPAAILAINPIE